jgi:Tfp pilus assembly protein PilZ
MTSDSPPSLLPALQPGQVLARPLLDPVKAVPLLAAGTVLTEDHLVTIQRLNLAREARNCLAQLVPPPAPAAARSWDEDDQRLSGQLCEEMARFFEAPSLRDAPFMSAWDLIRELVPRIQELDPVQCRDLSLPGGGTALHPLNVMLRALKIGVSMRMSREDLLNLALAALLHDIGVLRLGKERYKTTALSSYERRLLERHVEYGLALLDQHRDRFPPLSPAVRQGILAHHERWDGTGYPAGLKGEQIPRIARIIAIVDAYDVMISDQLYRERKLPEQAYADILAASGKAFDPAIVRLFKQMVLPYPNQTLVRLDTGAIARVVAQGHEPCRPIVALMDTSELIDLGVDASLSITRAVCPRRHPRVSRSVPVALRMPDEHGAYPGTTLNVGLGGACVAMDATLPIGAQLLMKVVMPEFPSLEVPALVVWSRAARGKTCLGLSFQAMPASAKAGLKILCR